MLELYFENLFWENINVNRVKTLLWVVFDFEKHIWFDFENEVD